MKLYVLTNDEVMDLWSKEFPILSKYNSSTIFAKSDIMLIGLRFRWSRPSYYKVSMEFVPLWTDWKGVDYTIYSLDLRPPKQFIAVIICYVENCRDLTQGLELAHKEFGPYLQEEVSLKDLLQFMEEMKISDYKVDPWLKNDPLIIGSYLRLKMALATYSNNEALIENARQQIIKITGKWKNERVGFLYGMTVEEWKKETFGMCEDRERFMRQIEINKSRPRIAKLKSIHITGLDISATDIPELNETFWEKTRDAINRFYHKRIF